MWQQLATSLFEGHDDVIYRQFGTGLTTKIASMGERWKKSFVTGNNINNSNNNTDCKMFLIVVDGRGRRKKLEVPSFAIYNVFGKSLFCQ